MTNYLIVQYEDGTETKLELENNNKEIYEALYEVVTLKYSNNLRYLINGMDLEYDKKHTTVSGINIITKENK